MLTEQTINYYLLQLLKLSILIRIICILIKLIAVHYNIFSLPTQSFISSIIFVTLIVTDVIIAYKVAEIFHISYAFFFNKHKYIEIEIEIIILKLSFLLLFLNQKITTQFVYYLNELSIKTQKHQVLLITLLSFIIFNLYIYKIATLQSIHLDKESLMTKIRKVSTKLLLKICIIIGILIGFLNPFLEHLKIIKLDEFAHFIFDKIKTSANLYIHSNVFFLVQIINILLSIWICIDIYKLYTHSQEKNIRKKGSL